MVSLSMVECSTLSLLIKRRLRIFACSGFVSLLCSKVSLVSLEQISAHFSLILGSTIILKVSYSKHSKMRSVVVLLNPISLQKMKSIFSFFRSWANLIESLIPFSESLSLQWPNVEQWVLICSPLQVIRSSIVLF